MKTKKSESAAAKKAIKYKKAPDAPKRFKSAFIIFSAHKHKEIKKEIQGEGKTARTTDIAKLVSEAWKKLDPEERKEWDLKAEQDKARYEAEKTVYKGPWKVPSKHKKAKPADAPKRPSSAFLAYSNSRRAALKRLHPKSTNADLSRMLAKSWKELPPTERAVYMAEERKLRDKYKVEMEEWRKKVATEKKAEREERANAALRAAAAPQPDTQDERQDQNNKWLQTMQLQQQQQDGRQQQMQMHDQQQMQMSDMASANMFSAPYLQAAAFGGGMGPGMGFNPASAGNPYFAGAFGNQGGYGMPSAAGNPSLSSLFGQYNMQNSGLPPPGLYGQNFGSGMGMNDSTSQGGQLQP